MTRIRMGLVPGLLLALALAVAACGGGGGKSSGVASLGDGDQATATTSAGGSQNETADPLAFARCVRQHGVNLPDPQITAKGIDQPPAPGVHRDDPRQQAAEQACQRSDKPGSKSGGK
jgi:hypothetical protein